LTRVITWTNSCCRIRIWRSTLVNGIASWNTASCISAIIILRFWYCVTSSSISCNNVLRINNW
jgi:hypothetical protein